MKQEGFAVNRIVSIIVPVYNVEPYIYECVDSLLGQTYRDLEIILVDDASPDNCPRICDEYALKDPRIKVIHKPNGGLSDARNAGIDVATGAYVMFVDSDDYIVPTMVEHLLSMMEQSGAGIASCGYTGELDKLSAETDGQFRVATAGEALKHILVEREISTSASTKLFETRLFEDVRFPVGKIYEDYATIYKVIHKAGKVAYNNENKYYYRPNPGGITGGKFYKKQMQYFEISEQVMAFVSAEYPEYEKYVNNRAERMAISFYKKISESGFDDRETIRFLARFIRKHIWRYLFSGYSPLSKMYGLMVSVMPRLALKVFAG